ncbi:uncharacterized protein LOC129922863 [Biomphalaria glabrata]|uniref:Uncharacterized protein LOC129922863 n=1 Tax=Biomphalaria glabrata TaxID=6526 RepID=A0A9W2YVP6_BIOGL|nr:uncharacterized protein LOC129922863 [Biomphalaria glabrata]
MRWRKYNDPGTFLILFKGKGLTDSLKVLQFCSNNTFKTWSKTIVVKNVTLTFKDDIVSAQVVIQNVSKVHEGKWTLKKIPQPKMELDTGTNKTSESSCFVKTFDKANNVRCFPFFNLKTDILYINCKAESIFRKAVCSLIDTHAKNSPEIFYQHAARLQKHGDNAEYYNSSCQLSLHLPNRSEEYLIIVTVFPNVTGYSTDIQFGTKQSVKTDFENCILLQDLCTRRIQYKSSLGIIDHLLNAEFNQCIVNSSNSNDSADFSTECNYLRIDKNTSGTYQCVLINNTLFLYDRETIICDTICNTSNINSDSLSSSNHKTITENNYTVVSLAATLSALSITCVVLCIILKGQIRVFITYLQLKEFRQSKFNAVTSCENVDVYSLNHDRNYKLEDTYCSIDEVKVLENFNIHLQSSIL